MTRGKWYCGAKRRRVIKKGEMTRRETTRGETSRGGGGANCLVTHPIKWQTFVFSLMSKIR